MIYRMLLTKPYAYHHNTVKYAPLHPAILRTCRQINEEATNILHGENIWIIWITTKINASDGPMTASRVPKASRKGAGNIKYPALSIESAFPITAGASCSYLTKITGEDGINDFLQTLWTLYAKIHTELDVKPSSLHLTLFETPFHTKSKLQSICLEPFRLVPGLQKLTIHGQVDPACVKKILHRATSGLNDITQILEVSQAYLDKGDDEYFAGEPRRACAQYEYGVKFLQYMYPQVNAPGRAPPTTVLLPFMRTMHTMLIRSARAHLALGDHEFAIKIGTPLVQLRHSRHLLNEARVQATLCTARAHRALGDGHGESSLFEQALNFGRDGTVFLTALAELFPSAASEQAALLVEQHRRLQSGEDIDLDVIRAYWEAV